MHVYTDGEDWWVAESADDLRIYEEDCGQPHDCQSLREMPDGEPLTMRLDPEADGRASSPPSTRAAAYLER